MNIRIDIHYLGRNINIVSVHGLTGSAERSAYMAAKYGIVGLTKVRALENALAAWKVDGYWAAAQ